MRILHVFRTPVGGLFRHVRDLVRGQSEAGHDIGILCDSTTGGAAAQQLLDAVKGHCKLGIHRSPISRMPGLGDLAGARAVASLARQCGADILHGHGAKGGAYARLATLLTRVPSVYTPHGGSLHFEWRSPSGAVFLAAEWLLARAGTGFCFVCDYERNAFDRKIGLAGKPSVIVHNGLWPEEFKAATPAADATDFLFVGEIRHLKGIDLLVEALARLDGATLTIVGDGPDQTATESLVQQLGLGSRVRFAGRLPIRDALSLGRIMVMPSRNESFPYVVLETAAAAQPMLASAAGGIPEVLPSDMLVDPLTVESLSAAMAGMLHQPELARQRALALQKQLGQTCDARQMCSEITAFYNKLQRGRI